MNRARPVAWDATALVLAALAIATPSSAVWIGLAIALLATLGLGHGAYDLELASGNRRRFVATYLATSAIVLVVWWVWPALALVSFLAVSAWHFGQADLAHLPAHPGRRLLQASRGVLFVGLPLALHADDAVPILDALGVTLALPSAVTRAVAVGVVLQHAALFAVIVPQRQHARELFALTPALVLLTGLPLLPGFVLAFSLNHAAAHVHALRLRDRPRSAHLRAAALWLCALLGTLLAGWLLLDGDVPARWWALAFAALSALTFPHMAVVHRWHALRVRCEPPA
ncbi:MAG: beta-carotene 15,15'-dioxygenase, Brp/Blh family [Myxococcota bacterium]